MAWENEKNGWTRDNERDKNWKEVDSEKIWPEMAKLCASGDHNLKLAEKRKIDK